MPAWKSEVLPSGLLLLAFYFWPDWTRTLFWTVVPLFFLSFHPGIADGLAIIREAPSSERTLQRAQRIRRALVTAMRRAYPVPRCTARLGLL
eukprot:7036279-Prymnesium_polylepis.1